MGFPCCGPTVVAVTMTYLRSPWSHTRQASGGPVFRCEVGASIFRRGCWGIFILIQNTKNSMGNYSGPYIEGLNGLCRVQCLGLRFRGLRVKFGDPD